MPISAMSSAAIVAKLTEDPEGLWAEFTRGKPLTQNRLAKLLGGPGAYGIISQTVAPPGQKTAKGSLRHKNKYPVLKRQRHFRFDVSKRQVVLQPPAFRRFDVSKGVGEGRNIQ